MDRIVTRCRAALPGNPPTNGMMNDPMNVLIVDNSEQDAFLTLRTLRDSGFQPHFRRVASGPEMSDALQDSSWQIVIADDSLPGFDGLAALSLIQQSHPGLPVIIISGTADDAMATAARKAGAQDLVRKDQLERLGPAVQSALREAETRRTEQELQNQEPLFRTMVERVADVTLVVDQQGTIRYRSPSVERVLGYPRDEFMGGHVYDFIHPDDISVARATLTRPSDQPAIPMECRIRHRDGSWRVLEGMATNLRHNPSIRGIFCVLRDVTERKRLDTQRFRLQRLESLGALASGIAHDLNNLLTPILIAADVLGEELAQTEHASMVEILQTGSQRAAELVQHLLSFAQGIGGGRQVVDPAQILRELDRLLGFSLPKSIALEVSVAPGLWPVLGDPTEILQVLINLCVNARDGMPQGGRLTVSAGNVVLRRRDLRDAPESQPGPYVHFLVIDTGLGIPPEAIEHLFEPFFTTKEHGHGMGLGLPMSLEIARRHRGLIRVYSQVERGTRFSVYLPAMNTPEAAATEKEVGGNVRATTAN